MNRVIPMIYVANVFDSVRFYERAVGGACDHADDDGSYAELRLGSVVLGLVDVSHASRHFPGEFSRHELTEPSAAFELYIEVEDVAEALARAIAAGATQLSDPTERPWGQQSVFLRDPDGVIIELASTPKNA